MMCKGGSMLSTTYSYGLTGINGYRIKCEIDINKGLPGYDIVGLVGTAIKESKERVKSAIKNSGFQYPILRLTINLAPADTKKEGPIYDLPIAIALLVANGKIEPNRVKDVVFLGELSLDGTIKKILEIIELKANEKNK